MGEGGRVTRLNQTSNQTQTKADGTRRRDHWAMDCTKANVRAILAK